MRMGFSWSSWGYMVRWECIHKSMRYAIMIVEEGRVGG
jgi:hypothetical protein